MAGNSPPTSSQPSPDITASSSCLFEADKTLNKLNSFYSDEPPAKRCRSYVECKDLEVKLGEILCCAVCLDLSGQPMYQCTNGHLICSICKARLVADAKLKNEVCVCPNCRCEMSDGLIRNLAVEKAIAELPVFCEYCGDILPRYQLNNHIKLFCQERTTSCRYECAGCTWNGPKRRCVSHEQVCTVAEMSVRASVDTLLKYQEKTDEIQDVYKDFLGLLCFRNVAYQDIRFLLRRTDDYDPRVYYETSHISLLGYQWILRLSVSSPTKDPTKALTRNLMCVLARKSSYVDNVTIHFTIIRGPQGSCDIIPTVRKFAFSQESIESDTLELPLSQAVDFDVLLSLHSIHCRFVMAIEEE